FPTTGPTASALAKQAVRLETVTPAAANAMAVQQTGIEQGRVSDVLARLDRDRAAIDVRINPGTRINVALWVQPIADGLSGAGTVARNDLGAFTVANDGTLTLPYAGTI